MRSRRCRGLRAQDRCLGLARSNSSGEDCLLTTIFSPAFFTDTHHGRLRRSRIVRAQGDSTRILRWCVSSGLSGRAYLADMALTASSPPLVCTWPAEYCEFNSKLSKCKAWLEDKHPSLYDKYYSDGASAAYLAPTPCCRALTLWLYLRNADAIKNKMGTLSLDKEKKLEADVEKAEKKAERKAAKEEESKKSLKVRGSGSRCPQPSS